MNKEQEYDKLLNIKTEPDLKKALNSIHYFPYEPTPYSALEELFEKYEVRGSDRIVDFGCGKGRINFYIHHFFKATMIGIERDEALYQASKENLKSYSKKHRLRKGAIEFYHGLAEAYSVHPSDTRFYFFNPFSIRIFKKTIRNVLISYEEAPREIELLLYYPSEDYMDFLQNQTPFTLKQEIIIKDLYNKNPYEWFLIYRLSYYSRKY